MLPIAFALVAGAISTNVDPCTADIAKAALAVGKAAAEISGAVSDCKSSPTRCASDISAAVTDLGAASQAITSAVTDCGGSNNTACAKDLTSLATALGVVGTSVTNAVDDCKAPGLKCIFDVGEAVVELAKIAEDITAATKDCDTQVEAAFGVAQIAEIVQPVQKTDKTNWTDCGLSNATMHFTSVVSTNPVHTNEQQYINKTVRFDRSTANITCEYAQYWMVLGHWVRFLDIKVNSCGEHPQLCSAAVGKEIFVETIHPPLNKFTPHGMYRSKQHYRDTKTGELLGCVDMLIPYVK